MPLCRELNTGASAGNLQCALIHIAKLMPSNQEMPQTLPGDNGVSPALTSAWDFALSGISLPDVEFYRS